MAKKSVSGMPPQRGVLKVKSAAIEKARLQRNWARFNRLTIADILGQLPQLQLASDRECHTKELTTGLFAVIAEAKRVLLKLTGAPGIICQDVIREACVARGDFGQTFIDGLRVWGYLSKRIHCDLKDECLVEPGDFYIKMVHSKSGGYYFTALGSASRERELRERFKRVRKPSLPGGVKVETPTAAQLQTLFDLSSEPPAPESFPTAS